MKNLAIILSFMFFTNYIQAQNLIPNSDFELGPNRMSIGWFWGVDSVCALWGDTVLGPDFWVVTNSSPDRMVEDDLYICPTWDNDTAQSGLAYINIGYPESGKTNLISPLEQDSFYHLSFYANLQSACGGSYALIIFYFNTMNDSIIFPYITNNEWQYYDTIFKATSIATEIEIIGGYGYCANIDNIILEKIVPTSIIEVDINKSLKIYPNPTKEFLWIDYVNNYDVKIYNFLSHEVSNISNKEGNTLKLNLSHLSKGIYFIQIKTKQEIITKKIVLTN